MTITAIAVVARNRVIGDGQDQPFKFREDWARFKKVTMGHPLIMGRKTHDAMGLLPGRTSIVVSRTPQRVQFEQPRDEASRGFAVGSLAEAIELAQSLDDQIYVIGGGQIYQMAWPQVDELDLTEVHAEAEGDVLFPEVDEQEWQELARDPRGEFDFVRYIRRAR